MRGFIGRLGQDGYIGHVESLPGCSFLLLFPEKGLLDVLPALGCAGHGHSSKRALYR